MDTDQDTVLILKAPNWDRRNPLCKQYGFRAAIIYQYKPGQSACYHRLRAKEFLAKRFGPPMMKNHRSEWIHTDSEWLAAVTSDTEYTIALKDPKLRNWILLM